MKSSKMILMMALIVGATVFTSCKKTKALKTAEGSWTVEDVTENGNSIFTEENVLNSGTITFAKCTSGENKHKACDAVISYNVTVLGTDTTLASTVQFKVLDKAEQMLFGDGTMDIETLTDNAFVFVDSEGTNKYRYKLKK